MKIKGVKWNEGVWEKTISNWKDLFATEPWKESQLHEWQHNVKVKSETFILIDGEFERAT